MLILHCCLVLHFLFSLYSGYCLFPELAVHKFACWNHSVFLIILYKFFPCVANNSCKHLFDGVLLAFKSIFKYDLCHRKWYARANVF